MEKPLCKLLIVDDEALIRQGIKHYVDWEKEGFRIVGEASNGQEALELIEAASPHIVLTDLVMPTMDGEELTKQAKARYPHIEIVVLSSFGEFDYVRSTFQSGVADYILKPKLEAAQLLKVLRATAARIPQLQEAGPDGDGAWRADLLVERLVAGYGADTESAAGGRSVFTGERFIFLCLDVKRLQKEGEPTIARLRERFSSLLAERLPGSVHGSCYAKEHKLIVFLANADERTISSADACIASLETASLFDERLAFLVGEPFEWIAEAGRAFQEEILPLAQASFYAPRQRWLTAKALPQASGRPETFPLSRFAEQLRMGQYEEAFGELKRHVRLLTESGSLGVFEYKSFLSNMIFNITVLLGSNGIDTQPLEREKHRYFNDINEAEDADAAEERLLEFLSRSAEAAAARSRAKPSAGVNPNMKKLLDFIEEHYAEPLSLKEMARRFHFNPSYLSSYFATHNREGFVEHVNRIRTKKAAELLRSHPATVAEISAMAGYSDHSYFCKVFKKIMGCSPTQYRRKHWD